MIINIFLTLIFLNIFLCLNHQNIANKFKIYDYPNSKLKIHKKKNTITGWYFPHFKCFNIGYC